MTSHTITPAVGAVCRCKAKERGVYHGFPHTIIITAEIESGCVVKDDLVPFRCSLVSSCAAPFQTEASRGEAFKGSTHNGRCDSKCPSARRLRVVREDTWASSVASSGPLILSSKTP
ncbi:hypothetical protein TNCV_5116501 [Trichonephila clavipes]|nr:hypothetical protein TNCV_5116501 [Trichonephila clavipes]